MMNVWQSHVMKVFLFACITSVIVIVFVWIWIGSGTMPCTKYHLVVLGTIPSKYFWLGRVPIWYEIFLHYGYDSRYIILIGSATTQNMRKILICSDTKPHTYYWLDWVPHLEHETICWIKHHTHYIFWLFSLNWIWLRCPIPNFFNVLISFPYYYYVVVTLNSKFYFLFYFDEFLEGCLDQFYLLLFLD